MNIEVSPEELRYIIRCGAALAQNVPDQAIVTYCGFDKKQIAEFSMKMRSKLDDAGLDL